MTDAWGQQPQQQQQWGQQQQPQQWGPPPGQQQPQQWGNQQWAGQQGQQQGPPEPPAPSAQEFFTTAGNLGGGGGAPSFYFSAPGVAVLGQIKSQTSRPKTQPGSPTQERDKNGTPLWQLNVVLGTALRNWQGLKEAPSIEVAPGVRQPVPPSEDIGERQIYLWYTLREAVEKALVAAGQTFLTDGWWLGVKATGARPNPKGGNPIKEYEAYYGPTQEAVIAQAKAAAGGQPQQAQQPVQQQAAPPVQQQQGPPPQSQVQQAQQYPGQQGNPQASQFNAPGPAEPAAPYTDEPPF